MPFHLELLSLKQPGSESETDQTEDRGAYEWSGRDREHLVMNLTARYIRDDRRRELRRLRHDPVESLDCECLPFLRQRRLDAGVTGQHDAEEEDAVGGHDRDRCR